MASSSHAPRGPPRQLTGRTLLLGMMLALADGRPAHLTRVHQALTALGKDDRRRLGVTADWKDGPHLLTCRQAEYTFGLVADALAKDEPDGLPSPGLAGICGGLLEASVPEEFKDASTSLAVDRTALESFSRPRRAEPATASTLKPHTVTADVLAKTAQKHDYPSKAYPDSARHARWLDRQLE